MKPLLVMAAALTGTAPCPGLEVKDAWIREAPPGAMMTAAYAQLTNTGKRALVIDGASARDFASATLHRTVVENGMSRMREGHLDLPPGAHAALEPGGWHLMLFEPARSLKAGDTVTLTLSCGQGRREFPFTVRASE